MFAGLVGGSIPLFDEIILSVRRMNNILEFDESSGVVTCEAGVVLQDLNDYVSGRNYYPPAIISY